jgi:hypothetical protein
MSYSVIWSKQAEKDFSSILDYLLENWGTVSAQKFQDKISKLYFYAHVPERREEAQSKLDALIATTIEPLSKGWNLAPNVEKAQREGHPNIEKLGMYISKICG